MPAAKQTFKPYPVFAGITEYDECERLRNEWMDDTASKLDGGDIDTLVALVRHGPLYDGDVPSKGSRDLLLDLGLAVKVVVSGHAMPKACRPYARALLPNEEQNKGYTDGYQAATYRGAEIYRLLFEKGILKHSREE